MTAAVASALPPSSPSVGVMSYTSMLPIALRKSILRRVDDDAEGMESIKSSVNISTRSSIVGSAVRSSKSVSWAGENELLQVRKFFKDKPVLSVGNKVHMFYVTQDDNTIRSDTATVSQTLRSNGGSSDITRSMKVKENDFVERPRVRHDIKPTMPSTRPPLMKLGQQVTQQILDRGKDSHMKYTQHERQWHRQAVQYNTSNLSSIPLEPTDVSHDQFDDFKTPIYLLDAVGSVETDNAVVGGGSLTTIEHKVAEAENAENDKPEHVDFMKARHREQELYKKLAIGALDEEDEDDDDSGHTHIHTSNILAAVNKLSSARKEGDGDEANETTSESTSASTSTSTSASTSSVEDIIGKSSLLSSILAKAALSLAPSQTDAERKQEPQPTPEHEHPHQQNVHQLQRQQHRELRPPQQQQAPSPPQSNLQAPWSGTRLPPYQPYNYNQPAIHTHQPVPTQQFHGTPSSIAAPPTQSQPFTQPSHNQPAHNHNATAHPPTAIIPPRPPNLPPHLPWPPPPDVLAQMPQQHQTPQPHPPMRTGQQQKHYPHHQLYPQPQSQQLSPVASFQQAHPTINPSPSMQFQQQHPPQHQQVPSPSLHPHTPAQIHVAAGARMAGHSNPSVQSAAVQSNFPLPQQPQLQPPGQPQQPSLQPLTPQFFLEQIRKQQQQQLQQQAFSTLPFQITADGSAQNSSNYLPTYGDKRPRGGNHVGRDASPPPRRSRFDSRSASREKRDFPSGHANGSDNINNKPDTIANGNVDEDAILAERAAERARTHQREFRTKTCHFFLAGGCKLGPRCTFKHEERGNRLSYYA